MRAHLPCLVGITLLACASPATAEPLGPLFEALRRLEAGEATGRVRIGWFGDSAIVSDGYTSEVRSRLQERFGDGGPGFVLAAPAFSGYRRAGLRQKHTGWETSNVLRGARRDGLYGYGGVQASSWGGASTTLTLSKGSDPLEEVRVHYRSSLKGGTLELYLEGSREPALTHPVTAEAEADHVWQATLPAPASAVKLRVGGGRARVYGIALERAAPGIVLDAIGVVGLRARRWRNADAAHLAEQVQQRDLGLVVINFGGNERVDPGLNARTHQAQVEELLGLLRQPADLPCLVIGPLAHGTDPAAGDLDLDPRLATLYAAQRAAASKAGCAFYDTIAAMGGPEAVRLWRDKRRIGGDLAHLNGRGHRALGQDMATWILARYDLWANPTAAVRPTAPPPDGTPRDAQNPPPPPAEAPR